MFWDFDGGNLSNVFAMMAHLQATGSALANASITGTKDITYLVNFPAFWTMCVDMVSMGSGFRFPFAIVAPGTDLRQHEEITASVDVAMLPKAIGGDAFSVDKEGKEDERCVAGFEHLRLSAFLESLDPSGAPVRLATSSSSSSFSSSSSSSSSSSKAVASSKARKRRPWLPQTSAGADRLGTGFHHCLSYLSVYLITPAHIWTAA